MVSTHNFAQDARFNEKKGFYADLVKSLRAIGGKMGGTGGEAHRAGILAGAGNLAHAHTHGRVTQIMPMNPKEAIGRLTSKEIRGMIKDSCSLIKTVDKDMIPGIERRVKRIYEGTSTPTTLQRYLENECDLEDWQAERIVRDQMAKYEAKAKLESMKKQGVKLVRWCAGYCEHHRPSHVAKWPHGLNGCVFDIDTPPVDPATGRRIYPGDEINCHCYLEVVE